MNAQTHWDEVYRTKDVREVSWFRPHLETPLALITRAAEPTASIIDVGGGASTLADDLVARGYRHITVLDIAAAAIALARRRLGSAAESVQWIVADVLAAELPAQFCDLWHDRAVFHFLTDPAQRLAYVQQAATAVKPGGRLVVSTFGLDGPAKCSGLDVVRYSAESLREEFGPRFHMIGSSQELHQTPSGAVQPFVYCELIRL